MEPTYVPCPHCGHPYPMTPMQKDLYRGRTLSCNNCAKPFSADDLTPVAMPAARPWAPAVEREPAAPPAPKPQRPKMKGWMVAALSVGGAALLVLLLVLALLPPLNRAREQSRRVQCASNMRQIGQAMFIYASVNGGQLPDRLDRLLPFAGSNVFVCPSSHDSPAPGSSPGAQAANLYAGGHLSYVYVGAGMTTNFANTNPATTVVLYEPLINHQDGVNVLYADGSVVFLPRGAAQTMIATLQAAAATQPATQPATPGG
jgi:prepilin-type processing-associated H-X9-DG protein